jgi:hypothetical protein
MARDLENEMTIPAFMKQATSRWPLHRKATQNERPGRKSEVLLGAFSLEPNALNRLNPVQLPFGNDEIRLAFCQDRTDAGESTTGYPLILIPRVWL